MSDNDGAIIEHDEKGALSRPTEDPEEVQGAIQQMKQQGYNVMAPKTYLQSAHRYEYALKVLEFDTNPNSKENRDWYTPTWKDDRWAPHKSALEQIAAAFGIEWGDSKRLDNFQSPNLAVVKVEGFAPDPATGKVRKYTASKNIDLRTPPEVAERTAEVKAIYDRHEEEWKAENELQQKRQSIHELAETGAMNRVIRKACNVRMDYTTEEMQSPFVVVSVTSTADPSEQQQIESEAQEAAGELYGADDDNPGVQGSDNSDVVDAEFQPPEDNDPEFPEPPDFDPNGPDAVQTLSDLVDASGYDYASKMQDAGRVPDYPMRELKPSNRRRLYEAAYQKWEDQQTEDSTDDDDIPF
ncbi:MAG: hypothetical protein ABEN55_11960 [Bradymonadaceae bacterium]